MKKQLDFSALAEIKQSAPETPEKVSGSASRENDIKTILKKMIYLIDKTDRKKEYTEESLKDIVEEITELYKAGTDEQTKQFAKAVSVSLCSYLAERINEKINNK